MEGAVPAFQYPRSDRRRCNGRRSGPIARPTLWPFSILGRIGGDATRPTGGRPGAANADFQYPRSDRRRCNEFRQSFSPEQEALLSVSSVGSEAMQLADSGGRQWLRVLAFSILGRIGGDATRCWPGCSLAALYAFSILGRIGGDATRARKPSPWGLQLPFSILGRIGGDATGGETRSRMADIHSFSILGRIGGDATRASRAAFPSAIQLSVSSVGSEAMQRVHDYGRCEIP